MDNVAFSSSGTKLAGQLYLPNSSRFPAPYRGVVVCHGIGSRKENHAGFCALLAERGFAVLAFDFRGHGESEGMLDENTTDDIPAALEFLAEQEEIIPDRLGLRGSSMGAFFALRAAACSPRVKAVAAIAPAMDSRFAAGLESGFLQQLLEREQMSVRIDAPSFLRGLRRRNTCDEVATITPRALLLIQCRGDELVPYAWTEELYTRAQEPKKLILLEGGHHTFAQQDARVHDATVEWFEQYL